MIPWEKSKDSSQTDQEKKIKIANFRNERHNITRDSAYSKRTVKEYYE